MSQVPSKFRWFIDLNLHLWHIPCKLSITASVIIIHHFFVILFHDNNISRHVAWACDISWHHHTLCTANAVFFSHAFICMLFIWAHKLTDPALVSSVLTNQMQYQTHGSPWSQSTGQVLMPVYSDTSEGSVKTSCHPPWHPYVFHLSFFDCFMFVLPFIWPVRTLTNANALFSPNVEQVSLLRNYLWVIFTATLVYIVGSDV